MSDTPTPDLTAPEQVNRLAEDMQKHMPWGRGVPTLLAIAVKLAEAEAELDAYREMEAESNARGGPSVIRLQMQARRDRIRAEKAEAEARERALLQSNDQERKVLVENTGLRVRLKSAEVERDALDAAWSERVALLEKAISKAEAERDAALGVLQEIADGNPTCDSPEADAAHSAALARAFLAARLKGGEG